MRGMLSGPPLPDFALAKPQPPRPHIGLIERPAPEHVLGRALLEQRLVLLLAPAPMTPHERQEHAIGLIAIARPRRLSTRDSPGGVI
jgi:hypothetical protein